MHGLLRRLLTFARVQRAVSIASLFMKLACESDTNRLDMLRVKRLGVEKVLFFAILVSRQQLI